MSALYRTWQLLARSSTLSKAVGISSSPLWWARTQATRPALDPLVTRVCAHQTSMQLARPPRLGALGGLRTRVAALAPRTTAQLRCAGVGPVLLCAWSHSPSFCTPHRGHLVLPAASRAFGTADDDPSLFGLRGYASSRSRSSSRRSASQSGASRDGQPVTVAKEDQDYWRDVLETITKPNLTAMKQLMDVSLPLGFTLEQARERGASIMLYDTFMEWKLRHPRCIVLTQIGDFYETIGMDALVMIQHLGFRPSAARYGVPKAGCPKDQKARTVSDLNLLGYSVVIITEAPAEGKMLGKPRTRFSEGVSSQARPKYLAPGGSLSVDQSNALFAQQRPIIGVAHSKSGFITHIFDPEVMKIRKKEGMTWDSVLAILRARSASCLLLHNSLDEQVRSHCRELTRLGRLEVGQYFNYSGHPTDGFVREVARVLQESDDQTPGSATKFEVVTDHDSEDGRPQPLPRSTAMLLGLEGETANQSLLRTVLPHGSVLCVEWMRQLLLMPPPPQMALHIQSIVSHLLTTDEPLSGSMNTDLPGGKVTEVLNSQSGDGPFFLELQGMLKAVLEMLENSGHSKMWEHVIPYAMWKTLRPAEEDLNASNLKANLQQAFNRIKEVVNLQAQQNRLDGVDSLDEFGSDLEESERVRPTRSNLQQGPEAVPSFRQANEGFKLIINRDQMREAYDKVDAAFQQLHDATQKLYRPIYREVNSGKPPAARDQIQIVNVQTGDYLAVRIPKGATISEATIRKHSPGGDVTCLKDHDVKGAGDVWMSGEMEEALDEYRKACADANKMADDKLKALCVELQGSLPDLILACQCSVTIKTLSIHTQAAHKSNWAVPTLVVTPSQPPATTPKTGPAITQPHMCMELRGYWPYWMRDVHPTVLNDVTLDRMQLLTGPNMAGKSTVLRSVCAISILANCGLMVPARRASVPFYDAYLLRNFSGDSPIEKKSSFALEMQEVNIMDRQCTSRSLVLLDEMSKGTEVNKGSALAAAVLMDWCKRGFTGMFATHLHALVPITEREGLEQQGLLAYKCMGLEERTEIRDGVVRRRWNGTWRLHDGKCFESLAFEVALDQGLRTALVDHAAALYQDMLREQFPWVGGTTGSRPEHMSVSDSEGATEHSTTQAPQTDLLSSTASSGDASAAAYTSDSDSSSCDATGTSTLSAADSLTMDSLPTISTDLSSSCQENTFVEVPAKTLEEAREVLCSTVEEWMALHAPDQADQVTYGTLKEGQSPPAGHTNQPAVYVVQWSSGQFYAGETLDVAERLKEHRRKARPDSATARLRHRGPRTCMVYAILPQSVPRAKDELESKVIEACEVGGFPLTSTRDKIKSRTGSSRRRSASQSDKEE